MWLVGKKGGKCWPGSHVSSPFWCYTKLICLIIASFTFRFLGGEIQNTLWCFVNYILISDYRAPCNLSHSGQILSATISLLVLEPFQANSRNLTNIFLSFPSKVFFVFSQDLIHDNCIHTHTHTHTHMHTHTHTHTQTGIALFII